MSENRRVLDRVFRHLLLWVVAVLAVGAGFCCDSKVPTPVEFTIAGFVLFALALGLGLWMANQDRNQPKSFLRITFTGSVLWVLFFAGCSAILTPVFKSARAASSNTFCLSNGKQLGQALVIYSMDFDDRLPVARSWRTSTVGYQNIPDDSVDCPLTPSPYDFAMNRAISTWSTYDVPNPAATPLVFETTTSDPNASGGRDSVTYRHGAMFCFVDGMARRLSKDSDRPLDWNPRRTPSQTRP